MLYRLYLIFRKLRRNTFSGLRSSRLSLRLETVELRRAARIEDSVVRVGVIIHVYYLDLIQEMVMALRYITDGIDIHITTPHKNLAAEIAGAFKEFNGGLTFHFTDNVGRDIGPFVAVYRTGVLDQYHYVLKLHTKKSSYSSKGDQWRLDLLTELLQSPGTYDLVKAAFAKSEVGLIGPFSFYLSHNRFWGSNQHEFNKVVKACLPNISCSKELGFFAGSMFWFKPQALLALKVPADKFFKFKAERGDQDGCLAHALERSFCTLARANNFVVSSPSLSGQEITDSGPFEHNSIPVL